MKSNHIFCIGKQVCRSRRSFLLAAVARGGISKEARRLTQLIKFLRAAQSRSSSTQALIDVLFHFFCVAEIKNARYFLDCDSRFDLRFQILVLIARHSGAKMLF